MACVNMFNPEQQGLRGGPGAAPPMSPRISFSNDFVMEPAPRGPPGPADPNFEFSVGSHPMMAADQLFSKGRLLPLKESRVTTLRDELRGAHDDAGHWDRPPKGSIRWKEFLGLKRAGHCPATKKGDKSTTDHGITFEPTEAHASKSMQDMINGNGGF